MTTYACKVAYVGRNFSGSQVQRSVRTVEGDLNKAFADLGFDSKISFASRTDKGVSALGSVFSVAIPSKLNVSLLNSKLADDVVVWASAIVDDSFNPRFADSRTYKHVFFDTGLDAKAMKVVVKDFEGKHSFHNFRRKDHRTPIRTVLKASLKKNGPCFVFTVKGDSFVWQQVRRMTNYVVSVGQGNKVPSLKPLFSSKVDSPILPFEQEGLVLQDVFYKAVKFKPHGPNVRRLKFLLNHNLRSKSVQSISAIEAVKYCESYE